MIEAATIGLTMAALAMTVSAVIFLIGRRAIPAFFVDDEEIIVLAASIMPIAAAFQLFDGVQGVGGGILRGMGTPRPAAAFNLVGYFVLGLPLALLLTFEADLGLKGIWWGLCLGLFFVAVALVAWVRFRGPATASMVELKEKRSSGR